MGGKCLIQMEVVFGLPYPVHYIYHTIFDRQANLVPQHHLPGEEGTATPALPAPDQESLPPPSHPDHLLQRRYRESADQLHRRLVWGLQGLGPEVSLERGGNSGENHGVPAPLHPGHWAEALPDQSPSPLTPPTLTTDCFPC